MKPALRALAREYSAALREYLETAQEAALLQAYQLGRRFIADGVGVLEVAALHQEMLLKALLGMLGEEEHARTARRAAEFFAEALAPFELSQQGIREANATLRGLNRELEDRVGSRTAELEKTLEDFRNAQAELDERRRLDRLKNEFIAIVSHELRTPLTSIHGSLGLLRSSAGGELSPRARQLGEVAYRNSERLVRLVNEILDLQRTEAGTMPFQIAAWPLRALLEQAVEANQPYASQLGVRLVLHEVDADIEIRVDPDRLLQVLTNLLANAAKFSPSGEQVVVGARRREGTVRVSVADRGPGIPKSFRSRIFEKFAQADGSASRAKGGSGLGLSIAKAIVDRLGGQIGFETSAGAGTTFYFDLPECRSAPAVRETAGDAPCQAES